MALSAPHHVDKNDKLAVIAIHDSHLMSTDARLGNHLYQLERYPLNQKNRSLQAWDAADELLIDHVLTHHGDKKRIFLINDQFGALACALSGKVTASMSDSRIAELGTLHNLNANDLPHDFTFISSVVNELPNADLVVIKLPKIAAYLKHMLALLSQHLPHGTEVIAAGKAKDIRTSTLNQFSHYLDEPTTSLAVKKARLIFCQVAKKPSPVPPLKAWPLENTDFLIHNYANVFSRDSLDIGARFFFNYLPSSKKKPHIIDLGCGNGVVGLMTLAKCPNAKVTFVDESAMAVASSQHNVAHNLPDQLAQCQFIQNDCLAGFSDESADIILCNPPFHQQNAVTDHIAWQMFNDAKRVLRTGGELRIVGNRHLDYHEKLKRLFGGYNLLGSNKKFVVLSAKKRA